jgi:hypothetical protein
LIIGNEYCVGQVTSQWQISFGDWHCRVGTADPTPLSIKKVSTQQNYGGGGLTWRVLVCHSGDIFCEDNCEAATSQSRINTTNI